MPHPKFIPEYSVADYQQWEGDWELFDGVPVSMTPSPSRDHQSEAGKRYTQLVRLIEENKCDDCEALFELDWIIDEHNVVRPDIVIVCNEPSSDHLRKPPALIAEILSPSTRDKDLGPKKDLYERNGVRWYLVIDPEGKDTALNTLTEGRYTKQSPGADGTYPIQLDDDCQIALSL